jgi:O-antigen/teichoic acid export membrane protein
VSQTARGALGNTARYMTATVVSMAMPFATLPIMTRWLTPADYGIVALGQVVAGFFMGFASLGLAAGLDRGFFKYEADARDVARLMHSGVLTVAASSAVLGVLLFAIRAPLAQRLYGDTRWATLLVVMALTSSLGVIASAYLSYLRNRERATAFMRWSVAGLVIESACAVALVALADMGPWGLALGSFIGKLLVAVAMWVTLAIELPPAFDPRMVREMLGIGVPLLPRTCLGVADNGIDRLLVNWLSSLGQVGLFGMANRVGYSVFSLMTSLEQVYLPSVYRTMFQGGADAPARLGATLSPYFVASVAAPALVALFVEELLWVLVTPAFYAVGPIAAVLACYYGQMFFGKIVGVQLVYAKKTWYSTPLAAMRIAVHLIAAMLLIEPFGALGAALALLVTGAVADTLGVMVGQRVSRVAYELRVVVPGMACLYAAVIWSLAGPWLGLPYGARLAGKAVLVLALLTLASRWLNPTQLRALRRPSSAAARA